MKGRVDFVYDRENDLILATPHWKIETREDVDAWLQQFSAYFDKFNRRMDLIVVLDDFEIGKTIGVVWGEARARMHQRFTRFSVRVRASDRVKLFVNTSGVRYGAATEEVGTVEEALSIIKALRREAARA